MLRDLRPIWIVVVSAVAIVLGTRGSMRGPPEFGWGDALYNALALFVLNGDFGDGRASPVWELQVARVLAPAVASYATVVGVLALSGAQLRLLWSSLLLRDHMMVAGLGAMGSRVALSLHEDGHTVLGVDREPSNPNVHRCRERGVLVLTGDASDPAVLRRVRLARATHVLVMCGQDDVDVDVAMKVAALAGSDRRRSALRVLVHLDDLRLWRTLSGKALDMSARYRVRLEYFNAFAVGVKALLAKHPAFPDRRAHPRVPHVLMVGVDGVGEQVLLGIVGMWRNSNPGPDESLRLTVAGPEAEAAVVALVRRYPRLRGACRLGARPFDLDSEAFSRGEVMLGTDGTCDVTKAYVYLPRESDALAAALSLHARPDTRHVEVVVIVAHEDSGIAQTIAPEAGQLAGVVPFGILTQGLRADAVLRGTHELLAQAAHEEYLRSERARGETAESNPSMVPWEALPDSLKDANRGYADGVAAKLAECGAVIVPDPLVEADDPKFRFTDSEVERLAPLEHQRWLDQLEANGWKHTPGPKDPERKLHPDLVSWSELSEQSRDKDRDAVRALPVVLARAGLRIHTLRHEITTDEDPIGRRT